MACCAFQRRKQASVNTEILVRAGWVAALDTTTTALAPLSAVLPRARLWRDFAAMLADSERQDGSCQVYAPQGLPRLRRALAARLLPRSPTAAGAVWRGLGRVRAGAFADAAAGLAARALETR